MAAICWLLVRSALRFGEWALLLVLLMLGNLIAQVTAGASHSGVFALNIMGIFALVGLVFETRLVVIAAPLFTAGYAAAQLHLHSTGDAAAATFMFAIVISLMG